MGWKRKIRFNYMYLGKPPWDTQISPPELMAFIEKYPPGRALDIGCGTGTNVITLAQHGWEACGIDFASVAIKAAKKKARKAGVNVTLSVDDATRMKSIAGPFDLILDMGCYHGLDYFYREAYLDNIDRLLAADGTFMVYVFIRVEDNGKSGIHPADIDQFSRCLKLTSRQDGSDRSHTHSAWLTFKHK